MRGPILRLLALLLIVSTVALSGCNIVFPTERERIPDAGPNPNP